MAWSGGGNGGGSHGTGHPIGGHGYQQGGNGTQGTHPGGRRGTAATSKSSDQKLSWSKPGNHTCHDGTHIGSNTEVGGCQRGGHGELRKLVCAWNIHCKQATISSYRGYPPPPAPFGHREPPLDNTATLWPSRTSSCLLSKACPYYSPSSASLSRASRQRPFEFRTPNPPTSRQHTPVTPTLQDAPHTQHSLVVLYQSPRLYHHARHLIQTNPSKSMSHSGSRTRTTHAVFS